jgi:hypothetical protein
MARNSRGPKPTPIAAIFAGLVAATAAGQTLDVTPSNSPLTIAAAATYTQVTVTSGGTLVVNAPLNVTGDLRVYGAGRVTVDQAQQTMTLNVAGRLTVDLGGTIEADVKGLLGAPAAGLGGSGATLDPISLRVVPGASMGGAHASVTGRGPKPAYGALVEPTSPGAGGARMYDGVGGSGGGVLRITAGVLELNGQLSANGGNQESPSGSGYAGGGAGGSVNLTVGSFLGSGVLSVNGGRGSTNNGSGDERHGGAGRIKVSYATSSFVGTYSAQTGNGIPDGTVHLFDRTLNQLRIAGTPTVLNGGGSYDSIAFERGSSLNVEGRATIATPLDVPVGSKVTLASTHALEALTVGTVGGTLVVNAQVSQSAGLLVRGTLVLNARLAVPSLDTEEGAIITHDAEVESMDLVVAGRLLLVAGARVDVVGMGYSAGGHTSGGVPLTPFGRSGATRDPSTSLVVAGSTSGSGGSHGGVGGAQTSAVAAPAFDTPTAPRFGGGGGGARVTSSAFPGGAGGGVARIAAGTLVLEGTIVADGALGIPGHVSDAALPGCGAGGSVSITVDSLSGTGSISARGGYGNPPSAAGGGGLIYISAGTDTFSGMVSVEGGGGPLRGGPGVLTRTQRPIAPHIVSVAPTQVKLGDTLLYRPLATGAMPLTWSLPVGPVSAELLTSGQLSWLASTSGPQPFSLRATNGFGSDTQAFIVEVLVPPVVTSTANGSATVGTPYQYDADGRVDATGSGPIGWSASFGPAAFSVDAVSGEVRWVPLGIGSYAACVVATNAVASAQQCFTVSVAATAGAAGPTARAPRFTSSPSTSAACGGAYHYSGTQLPEVDGDGPFAFSLASVPGTALPTGLVVDATTGELNWTPTREQAGAHPLMLTVEGASGSATQTFSIVVDCPDNRPVQVSCGCSGWEHSGAGLAALALLVRGRRKAGREGRQQRAHS